MATKIISEVNNKLLGRKEIKASITYEGATPNREEVKKKLGVKGHLVIRKIIPEYGNSSAIIEAMVYDKKEMADKLESSQVMKKNTKEKPKEEAKEETPVTEASEDKKEEPKAEETKPSE